jgi:hypothetical protein
MPHHPTEWHRGIQSPPPLPASLTCGEICSAGNCRGSLLQQPRLGPVCKILGRVTSQILANNHQLQNLGSGNVDVDQFRRLSRIGVLQDSGIPSLLPVDPDLEGDGRPVHVVVHIRRVEARQRPKPPEVAVERNSDSRRTVDAKASPAGKQPARSSYNAIANAFARW